MLNSPQTDGRLTELTATEAAQAVRETRASPDNPWGLGRTPGGWSGGESAAIAGATGKSGIGFLDASSVKPPRPPGWSLLWFAAGAAMCRFRVPENGLPTSDKIVEKGYDLQP